MDNAQDMIYRMSLPDGLYEYVSPASTNLFGYTPEEFIQKPILIKKAIHQDWQKYFEDQWVALLAGDMPPLYEYQIVHGKTGETRWLHQRNVLVKNEAGQPVAIEGIVTDITDRRQNEEALRQSESNLSSLINNRNESIWSVDRDFNYLIFNDYFQEDYFKTFKEELRKGLNALDIISPELRAFWEPKYKSALKGNRVVFEFQNESEGELHHFEITLNPTFIDNEVTGVSGISMEITDRKQAEDSLRESEERFRNIVTSAPIGIFIYDLKDDGKLTFIDSNQAASSILGVDCSKFVGMTIEEAFPPLTETEIPDIYREVAATGKIWQTEQVSYKHEEIEGAYQVTAFRGATNRAVIMFQDITLRKQAEDELLEKSANMSAIIENTADSIWTINRSYEVVYMNSVWEAAFFASFGIHIEPGHVVLDKLPDALRPIWKERYDRALANERFDIIEEIPLDTGSVHVEVAFNPIVVNNSVVGVSVFGRDVTERKEAEKKRLLMEQELLQTQKLESLGVLAGGIAHDFNNILMGILGYADLALSEMDPYETSREYVKGINDSARQAADLVKQMLAYSGKGKFSLEPINLNHLIEDTVQMLTISISKNVVLKFNYSSEPGFLEGDPSQLRQIIMNLVINASEAIGKRSGVIAVTTGSMYCDKEYIDSTGFETQVSHKERIAEGMYLFLEISDTGIGMKKSTLDRLFEPFYTTKYTGRGLGLSAVLGIVRGHHGMIKIYSEEGKGTSFKVLFPLYGGDDGQKAPTETTGVIDDGWQGEGTFLIADDEEAVRTVGKHMLKKLGFEVLTADDGRIAVELFKKHAKDIVGVLLDLTMPHKDGAQVFQEIRQIKPDVKVILSSGYNEQDATQQFVGKGLAGFIQKPYVSRDLVKKIKEIMRPGNKD